jgi:hypothetical protein
MKQIKLSILVLVIFLVGCQKDVPAPEPNAFKYAHVKASNEYNAELAQEWMNLAYNSVKARGFFALDASRLYSYTSLAMYESMVHGNVNGKSMEGQLKEFNNIPKPIAGKTYDWGIVLCHSTPKVLLHMLNAPNAAIILEIENLEKAQERRIRQDNATTDQVIADSKSFAAVLADYIIQYANTDGTSQLPLRSYTMPSITVNPAFYDGIEQANPFFMMPFWWASRPFAISSHEICLPKPPYTYSEDPASKYYQDVLEVLDATKDPEKVEIGRYWANNPLQSGTPAGSWLGIGNQLVDQYNLDMETTLKMYVLLTLSTRDTFIAVWWTKYKWNLQRPVSYIRRVLKEDNWNSPVPTPPYPDYVSGTSANAGSSSEMLTQLFGRRSFTDAQHTDKGFAPRTFSTFKAAGEEAFHSRIYAGVHMRKACEEGFKMGECVSRDIISKLQFTN